MPRITHYELNGFYHQITHLSAPVIPDKNLGTVDSLFNSVVTADPATGSFTNNTPPSPPWPNARANTASPLSRKRDAQVWATPASVNIEIYIACSL